MRPLLISLCVAWMAGLASAAETPNIVLIYADDLGFGDLGCYGATKVATPNVDRLSREGLRFTNAHSTSSTCTPSRYAMLSGEYPWRKQGTGILPGDANLIVPPGKTSLPGILQKAGFTTGVVGKWHLGLGDGKIDWNQEIKPGPREIGFDYSFLIPATADRVPCVFVENQKVVGLDPADPVAVSYDKPIGNDPTGQSNPEMLKYPPSHGHNQTIVNGISRIGYMTGGKAARWVDEDIADVLTKKCVDFMEQNKAKPFFLYFATHDIHVPRMPHSRFAGKSGCGIRGDVIQQFDWCVGEILNALERLNLNEKTLVILSSDNGPVVDDGYKDGAFENLNGHQPGGPYRGSKYSLFEAGTRVPFIVRWTGRVKPGVSEALFSQVDFAATFAALTGQQLAKDDVPDSLNMLPALLGESSVGRDNLVSHSGTLSLVQGDWKYIEPSKGAKFVAQTHTETGRDTVPQLYRLDRDPGETTNLAPENADRVREMSEILTQIKAAGRSR